jgi:hypothetical protein
MRQECRRASRALLPRRGVDDGRIRCILADQLDDELGRGRFERAHGKQVDQFLGDEFRRQTLLDPSSLAWLMLHETLEVTHADASRELADLIPPYGVEAAHRGMMGVYLAGWAFLDALYVCCYCRS